MSRVPRIPAILKLWSHLCAARLPQGGLLAIAVCMAWLSISACSASARTSIARMSIVERPLDLKRGRGYEELEIRVDAVLDTPGTYSVTPIIQLKPECDSWTIPGTVFGKALNLETPAEDGQIGFNLKTDSEGRLRFTVRFDGDNLWRFEENGPWSFCCRFLYVDNIDPVTRIPPGYNWIEERLETPTRRWDYRKFARRYGGELARYGHRFFETRSCEELVYTQENALVVATVTAADTGGTNASPPRVQIRVTEVLYGHNRVPELSAEWMPAPLSLPCLVGEGGTVARWKATRISTPPVGSRWILAGKLKAPDGPWQCAPYGRWVYSDSLRAHFKRVSREWPARMNMYKREAAEAATGGIEQ